MCELVYTSAAEAIPYTRQRTPPMPVDHPHAHATAAP
jgi:hypothetical protein